MKAVSARTRHSSGVRPASLGQVLPFPAGTEPSHSHPTGARRLRRPEGRDQPGGGAGRVWGGASLFPAVVAAGPGRAARGRRWGRAAPRVAEQPRRPSLPRRAPRRPAAARRAGRAAGQSGRPPTRPRPCRGPGRRVGRGPGRRRGAPRKGPDRADITGAPGCRLGLRADSGAPGQRGDPGGALRCPSPSPFRPASWEECECPEQRFSKWGPRADSRLYLRLSEPDSVLWPGNLNLQQATLMVLMQGVTEPHFGGTSPEGRAFPTRQGV